MSVSSELYFVQSENARSKYSMKTELNLSKIQISLNFDGKKTWFITFKNLHAFFPLPRLRYLHTKPCTFYTMRLTTLDALVLYVVLSTLIRWKKNLDFLRNAWIFLNFMNARKLFCVMTSFFLWYYQFLKSDRKTLT